MNLEQLATLKKLKEQQLQLNNEIAELEKVKDDKPTEKPATKPEDKPKEKTLEEVQKEHDEKRKAILLQEIADFDKRLNASNETAKDTDEVKETAEGKERPKYVAPIPDFLKNKLNKDQLKELKENLAKEWDND